MPTLYIPSTRNVRRAVAIVRVAFESQATRRFRILWAGGLACAALCSALAPRFGLCRARASPLHTPRPRRARRRLSTGHRGKHSWYDSRKHTHGHGCKHDPAVSRRSTKVRDESRAPQLRFRTDESRFDSWRERGSILERASRGGLPLGPGPKRLRRPPLFLAAIAGSPRARGVCEARTKSYSGKVAEFGLEVSVGAPYGRVTFAKMP